MRVGRAAVGKNAALSPVSRPQQRGHLLIITRTAAELCTEMAGLLRDRDAT